MHFRCHCDTPELSRSRRKGFVEHYVFPLMHLFPWKCEQCGGRRIRFKRAKERQGAHTPVSQG